MPTVTVPIPASINDQVLSKFNPTYDAGAISRDTIDSFIQARKAHTSGGSYSIWCALLLFPTGDYLPDNAVVSSASLTYYQVAYSNDNNRWLVGDYFTYTATNSDYSVEPSGTAVVNTIASLAGIDVWRTVNLLNVSNISATGATSIRLGISGGAPPLGDFNFIDFRSYDYGDLSFVPYLTITYSLPSTGPTANFSYSTSPGSAAFTDASTAVSPATITVRSWNFGDNTGSSATNPTHNYAAAGNYSVQLVVTDSTSLTSQIFKTVTIPTRANFTYTNSASAFTFAESNSLESGTTVTSRSWTFGDGGGQFGGAGGTSTLANPTYTYAAAGTYTVTYSYTDSLGHTWTTSKVVSSPPPAPNQPPTAFFTASVGALTVNFTDNSSDPDGTIVSWAWNFGDGGTSTTQHPSHSYASAGTYTVALTVTDDDGATNTYTKSLTVRTAGSAHGYVAGPMFLRESTLTENIDATQTTIPVAELAYWPPNSALWPAKNEGMLDPEGAAEKITWTGKSARHGPGLLTGVTRGAFGTTAASHISGKIVGLYGRHDAGLLGKCKIPLVPTNASLTIQELRRHFDSERFVWADFNYLNEQAQLEITGSPTSSGNVSTTLDENGVAVTRNAGVTGTKELRSLVISAPATVNGTVTVTLNSIAQSIAINVGVVEKHQIVLSGTAGGSGAGSVGVYWYDASNTAQSIGVTYYGGESAATIASRIRAQTYSGWTISGTGATIIATATAVGPRGQVGTGLDGGFTVVPAGGVSQVETVLAEGSSVGATAIQVADIIRATSFSGWQTGGTVGTTTVTFTALEPGIMAGTFSYNNGGTGATGTMSQTTAGAQTTTAQVATAIRALYAGNAYWQVGGSGSTVIWDALTSGPKQDATFSGSTTGTQGNMQTTQQGSADIVAYLADSGGIEQSRRVMTNLATITEFNLETSVSGSGTEHGIVSVWGSFGTDPLVLLWRVENLDLTDFPVGEGAYGVTSESASGLTWDVRWDEVEPTTRGKTYYRDHNLKGQLLGQLHYFGLLEPEQAREDIFVQEWWQPVHPGQQVSLAFWMFYENLPVSFPCKPLYITFHHIDGTVTEYGEATGSAGLSGDAAWQEYIIPPFNVPTLDDNPVPVYWMHVQSRNMSKGTIIIQEIVPTIGPVPKRTPYYTFEGNFRAQLDTRTPLPVPYVTLGRRRVVLETLYKLNEGIVYPQYRSAADPTLFDATWYTNSLQVPDLPVIDAELALSGDGLSTPEVLHGYPRAEYQLYAGATPHSAFLLADRTELPGTVLIAEFEEWYPNTGVAISQLPSGRTRRTKVNEPVGFLPAMQLIAFKREAIKYIQERWGTELFIGEIRGQSATEVLTLKLQAKPVFERQSRYMADGQERGNYWISSSISAEVMAAAEMPETSA